MRHVKIWAVDCSKQRKQPVQRPRGKHTVDIPKEVIEDYSLQPPTLSLSNRGPPSQLFNGHICGYINRSLCSFNSPCMGLHSNTCRCICVSHLPTKRSPDIQSQSVILPHDDQIGKEGRERHITESQRRWAQFWRLKGQSFGANGILR